MYVTLLLITSIWLISSRKNLKKIWKSNKKTQLLLLRYILHDFCYNILITDKILQDRNKLDCKIWLIRPIFVLRTGFRSRSLHYWHLSGIPRKHIHFRCSEFCVSRNVAWNANLILFCKKLLFLKIRCLRFWQIHNLVKLHGTLRWKT